MNYIKRPRAFYLFAAIIVSCVLIAGCRKPDDVECVDLSEQAWGRDHYLRRWK